MRRALLLALAVAVAIAACGDSEPPATGPAPAPARPRAAAVVDAGVSVVATVPYLYNPVAKRDPFRNLLEEPKAVSGVAGRPAEGGCNEPLCNFDLEQLTLVAVVSGDANPVGMLEDPTRVGHLVHRNSRVGKQGGKVTQIQRDCVVVTEYFQSPDGKVNPNRVNICIKADKRSVPVLDLLQNKLFEAQ